MDQEEADWIVAHEGGQLIYSLDNGQASQLARSLYNDERIFSPSGVITPDGLWVFRACRVFASREAATYGVPISKDVWDVFAKYTPGRDYGAFWMKEALNMVAVFGSFNGGEFRCY